MDALCGLAIRYPRLIMSKACRLHVVYIYIYRQTEREGDLAFRLVAGR
jgi:hypothetical protein